MPDDRWQPTKIERQEPMSAHERSVESTPDAASQRVASGRDLSEYRGSAQEQARVASLFGLMPASGATALDIGARDGFLSVQLAGRFTSVTALDLQTPQVIHPRVTCAQGDIRALAYPADAFELVLCSEVLEHIPPALLEQACNEISRVASGAVVIGVPFRQDTRVGRTTCGSCGKTSPPWGHLNVFDEERLRRLFPSLILKRVELIGHTVERTNAVSALLMDLAGNPYGTYEQDEGCVHCGASLAPPRARGVLQRIAGAVGSRLTRIQQGFLSVRPIWIHALFIKS